MEDVEVIQTFLESQASLCFTLLYNRYSGKIYAKCIAMLKDEVLAQDATQEIFMKIFLNLSRFGGKSKFSTWIYSITYNFCIDFIRKKHKIDQIFSDEIEKLPDVKDEISDEALFQMSVDQLKTVLDHIPIGDKAVLLMKYQDDMSIKDISEVLDKSESAIKMKLKRAKEKAQKLKEDLFASASH